MFIKVTLIKENKPTLINVEHIISIEPNRDANSSDLMWSYVTIETTNKTYDVHGSYSDLIDSLLGLGIRFVTCR